MVMFFYFCALMKEMKIIKANTEDVSALNALVNSAYRGEESKRGWTTEAEILDGLRIDEKALAELFGRSGLTILKSTTNEPNYIDKRNGISWITNPVNPSENFADK